MSKINDFDDHTYATKDFWHYMRQIEKAMCADIILACAPATLESSAASVAAAIAGDDSKYVSTIEVSLRDSDGNIHEWYNGSLPVAVTKSSTDGLAALDTGVSAVELVNGIGKVNINYTGTWVAADTCTLTVTSKTISGVSTGNKTSVDTLTA